jgi:hypothetical protein
MWRLRGYPKFLGSKSKPNVAGPLRRLPVMSLPMSRPFLRFGAGKLIQINGAHIIDLVSAGAHIQRLFGDLRIALGSIGSWLRLTYVRFRNLASRQVHSSALRLIAASDSSSSVQTEAPPTQIAQRGSTQLSLETPNNKAGRSAGSHVI